MPARNEIIREVISEVMVLVLSLYIYTLFYLSSDKPNRHSRHTLGSNLLPLNDDHGFPAPANLSH